MILTIIINLRKFRFSKFDNIQRIFHKKTKIENKFTLKFTNTIRVIEQELIKRDKKKLSKF